MVQWTSVPGKTGTIHYCNNINKYGVPAESGSVPGKYGTMD